MLTECINIKFYIFREDLEKFTTSLAYCIPFNMGIDAIPFSDPLERKNRYLICPMAKCLNGYRVDQNVEFCLDSEHEAISPCKNTKFDIDALRQHCSKKSTHCVFHRAILIYTESRNDQINKSRSGISSKNHDKIALAKKRKRSKQQREKRLLNLPLNKDETPTQCDTVLVKTCHLCNTVAP